VDAGCYGAFRQRAVLLRGNAGAEANLRREAQAAVSILRASSSPTGSSQKNISRATGWRSVLDTLVQRAHDGRVTRYGPDFLC